MPPVPPVPAAAGSFVSAFAWQIRSPGPQSEDLDLRGPSTAGGVMGAEAQGEGGITKKETTGTNQGGG